MVQTHISSVQIRWMTFIRILMITRCRKLNISLVFITQDVRLNSTHYLIMKISNRIELKHIAINHSAD